jgi:uncharacterized protein with LGFP repeats
VRYRRPKPSIVLGTVAAVVVASPVAILVGGSAPNFAVDPTDAPVAQSVTPTTINQISLNDVPTLVLNLVKSGLADVGVTLPPIDISGIELPDIPLQIPSGVIPTELLPSTTAPESVAPSGTTTSGTTPPSGTTSTTAPPGGAPADPGTPQGALVKEISQDKPFSMVGLTWDGVAETTAYIRAKQADGSWGPWISADKVDGVSNKDPDKQGTEPVWVGDANVVQIAITNDGVAAPGAGTEDPAAPSSDTSASGTPSSATSPSTTSSFTTPPVPQRTDTSIPTSTVTPGEIAPRVFTPKEQPMLTTTGAPAQDLLQQAMSSISAALISPGSTQPEGQAPAENAVPIAPAIPVPAGDPQVISRAQWGADESMRCSEPTYDPALRETIVHHTAGNNDYTPEQSGEIVRGIYAYHAQTLGWCDIGYNVLVDKYGQIFEGTAGGLDKNVQATHTGGFNQDTMGLALMGNLNEVQPTPEMINAAGSFLGWKLRLNGLDPNGQGSVTSIGFPGGLYAAGETATVPMISGHRDFYSTDCPGQFGYDALPQIRAIAAGSGQLPTANPEVLSTTDTGAIAQQWQATGGPTGELGNATSTEQTTPDGTAKYVDFENGKIYWSEATGAQIVKGAIQKAWAALGFETGSLGLPTSGETSGQAGISQSFQGGTLVFNLLTGIVEVLRTYVDEYTNSYNEQRGTPAPATTELPTTAPPA